MAANTAISDEVWNQLDPDAGRLSPRDRRRGRAVLASATVVTVAVASLWWIGALRPRMSVNEGHYVAHSSAEDATFSLTVQLANDARLTERIRSVGRSGPGLQLISVEAPAELAGWTSQELTLHYRVTDCAAVPKGAWPIPVRVENPWQIWGTSTVWVARSLEMPNNAPDAKDFSDVAWQQEMSRTACKGTKFSISSG